MLFFYHHIRSWGFDPILSKSIKIDFLKCTYFKQEVFEDSEYNSYFGRALAWYPIAKDGITPPNLVVSWVEMPSPKSWPSKLKRGQVSVMLVLTTEAGTFVTQ